MRRRIALLAALSPYATWSRAFSIHDDLLAFPQYEVVFSDSYISHDEAESQLIRASSIAHSTDHIADPEPSEAPSLGLSTRNGHDEASPIDGRRNNGPMEAYERMVLNKRSYLCSIPTTHPQKNETQKEASPQDEEKELARATDRGWQLLQDLNGQCLYYQSGWWSYSFCYQTEVKQFHPMAPPRGGPPAYPPVEDTRVPAFILGEFQGAGQANNQPGLFKSKDTKESKFPDASDTELALLSKGDVRYLSQNLTGGTVCDLTGKPRKVEVQFHCHPQSNDRIGWIKETATCTYLMVIYTPRLCNDVAFQPPKEHQTEQIVCREILTDAEVGDWQARKAADAERLLVGSSSKTGSRPVVGGIEVGGYKQVPHENARIRPPQAVEQIPNQGDVIAQWHPSLDGGIIKRMSDDDLKKLELDPRTVDRMKEEIHREADGRPWKLEIVELGGGIRELIGVVEADDGPYDDEEQQEQGEGSQEVFKDEL